MNLGQNKKIVVILPTLKAGGAERVLSYVSSELHNSNFDITLIVLGFEKDKVYDTGNLNVVYLNKSRLLNSVIDLLIIFNTIKPNVVISSIIHINIMMGFISVFYPRIKFICREASVISNMINFSKFRSLYILFVKFSYKKFDAIVCQSNDMKKDFVEKFNISENKIFIINNPLTNRTILKKKSPNNDDIIRFITVGRLSSEKGYKRILEQLAQIKSYNFIYTIIGSGPEINNIKDLIKELKIIDKVNLIPFTKNILDHLSNNDLFLQGSHVEGFPNALLESCSVGTPVLAFNAPGGTKEIVVEGINGFLVNDEFAFFEILNNFRRFNSFNENDVKLSVSNKFDSNKIVNQYIELLDKL